MTTKARKSSTAKLSPATSMDDPDTTIYKTVTLRLNQRRYKLLTKLCYLREDKIQRVLTRALDNLLDAEGVSDEQE